MVLSLRSFVLGIKEGGKLLPQAHLLYRLILGEPLCEPHQWIFKIYWNNKVKIKNPGHAVPSISGEFFAPQLSILWV